MLNELTDKERSAYLKAKYGASNYRKVCPECDRAFDISDRDQATEWYYGHDCEAS